MTINKTQNGDEVIFALEGKLDTITAPDLDAALKESFSGAKKMVLDFANLQFISSAGLRVILNAQKVMNEQGDLVIKNAGPQILEVFEITGFSDFLKIE